MSDAARADVGHDDAAAPEGAVLLGGIRADDVQPLQLYRATMPNGTALCVGVHEGRFFAVKDHCTHAEFPLSEGTLYADGQLECCWHGARFACTSGKVLRGPAEDDLVPFDVYAVNGALYVRRAVAPRSGGGR
ncbi:MAG: Rieske 2Fe-2S domain-containing protein [Gemmatimonadaceae bacterium]|nr:Rieske 2Fe-2S domain-containing protein [Gemmatimonadaceae bacterium]MCW5826391.1 Rieske 2Fe-2S domain-containing protein [Gemmatimonadaceae bacterium]